MAVCHLTRQRLAASLSIAQLAKLTHIPQQKLRQVESGERRLTVDDAVLIAAACRCDVADLYDLPAPKPGPTYVAPPKSEAEGLRESILILECKDTWNPQDFRQMAWLRDELSRVEHATLAKAAEVSRAA